MFEACEMRGSKTIGCLTEYVANGFVAALNVLLPFGRRGCAIEIGRCEFTGSGIERGVATKPVVEENRTIIGDLTIGGRSVGKNLACDCIEWRQSGGAKPRMNGAHNGAVCIRVAIERQDKTRCAQSCASAQRRVALQALPGKKSRIGPGSREAGIC